MALPDRAYFGEKDFQQLQVIRRMVRDLNIPTAIVGVPTIRESDGLAMSSRNAYLSPAQRRIASALPQVMQETVAELRSGLVAAPILAAAKSRMHKAGLDRIDYLELCDEQTLQPIAIDRGDARQAARQVTQIGKERLSNGRSVLIFPEGTRIEPGSQGTYSRGGASLACAANVPVVPVAHNAGLCWPAHRFTKYPGTIRVEVGPPIDCSGRTAREVNAEAEAWIESRSLAMLPPGMATPGAAETP
jgi:hypothetical protein